MSSLKEQRVLAGIEEGLQMPGLPEWKELPDDAPPIRIDQNATDELAGNNRSLGADQQWDWMQKMLKGKYKNRDVELSFWDGSSFKDSKHRVRVLAKGHEVMDAVKRLKSQYHAWDFAVPR